MSSIPANLLTPVRSVLIGLGDDTPIHLARSTGGGCINNAHRIDTARRSYLLKWNTGELPGMFSKEADGLTLIRATDAVRVPEVYHVSEAIDQSPAFILMEWLEPGASRGAVDNQALLGESLALMHQRGLSPQNPPAYGLGINNYIGSSIQINGWDQDWITFFREKRLGEQMNLARRNGRMPTYRQTMLEQVVDRLDHYLEGIPRRPALLHGDLWSGNVIPAPEGLAVIDPAVYYGDREADIAFTTLFGGFSQAFYQAYHAAWPLDPGFSDRRDLYNLYHLLNHLNLFGESYGSQVDSVLRSYT